MNPEFWRGKNVFLTGHTGFKGGWLSLWLQSLGAKVTGFALEPSTSPCLFEVAQVGKGMTSIIGDVRDGRILSRALQAAEAEIVVHMAAQPLVRHSYSHPVETYQTNVMGTVNILESVRASTSVKAVVVVTSDKCYENREWAWGYRESEPMGGHDPYSNSKGCAELVTAAYRASFFTDTVAVATGRAGNVIGGGDWAADRLVPDIIRSVANGQAVRIRNPDAIRPWQHVLEPLNGYLTLAEQLVTNGSKYAEGWNFGPGDDDTQPVNWIVEKLCAAWGDGASWQIDGVKGPHEAHYLKLDCSKARTYLKWRPAMRLETGIEKIVQWHKAHRSGDNMHDFTMQQIAEYQREILAQRGEVNE